ncbi:MAG: gliding motility-associated ABC transporter substrate-binding protein GldG, partial [Saprospiraceae bacterium]|nr:gliding motility-associated ABC transporter substrate-binding protein GldG [Saprospiraceae bacterium]
YGVYVLLLVAALAAVNIVGEQVSWRLDLTEDKKFTLTNATKNLLASQEDPILVDVLLEGDFPAGFKRLQNAVRRLLVSYREINPAIVFQFRNPLDGAQDEVNAYLEELAQVGIFPTEVNVRGRNETSTKQVYPYAIFKYADREIAINLLEKESAGRSAEESLNHAINLLEFKCSNAITKLRANRRPNILFTSGHGELNELETASFERNLQAFYSTGRIRLDSIFQIPSLVDLLIIAKPKQPFSDKETFVLDQYLMNGGKLMLMIDPIDVSLDSIQRAGQYVPHDIETGLDAAFFRYGFRVQRNLVLDFECSSIPLQVGGTRDNPQFQLFNWFYHPLALGDQTHPISKGIERINLLFPASIDTIRTKTVIDKTILLRSSRLSRVQQNPVLLDFNVLREEPDPNRFGSGPQNLAVLLEGKFPSYFENRVSTEMQEMLNTIDAPFKPVGEDAKILVISDGDVAKSTFDVRSGAPRPVGYNPYMKYTFGNEDFLVNGIEYLLDRDGLTQARSRNIELRLLDRQRLEEEKGFWRMVNLGLPALLILLGGFLYHGIRKRRYAH